MEGFEFYQPKKWLSPTGLCAFCRCPRYYFYMEGCNMRTEGKASPLVFGGGIHAGLPYAFQGDFKKAMEAFFASGWKDEYYDDKRNPMRAEAMFRSFYDAHKDGKSIYIPITAPKTRLVTPEHNSEYEVPFAVDIGLPVPLVGLVDCLGKHRDTGKTWIVECKTSSELGQLFLQCFGMNPQVLCYSLAMKILLGEEIEGVFVEGLLVAKVETNTIIIPVYVKDFLLEDTLRFIKYKYAELQRCEAEKDFPKNPTGCNAYAMFAKAWFSCPFQMLCETTPNWTDLKELYVFEERKERPF